MNIINTTETHETDEIFAKNLRKAVNDVKLQEPVIEQSTGASPALGAPGVQERIEAPPQPRNDLAQDRTFPQIVGESLIKVRGLLVTSANSLRNQVSANPWNEEARSTSRDIEEALSELENLASSLRKFNMFGGDK